VLVTATCAASTTLAGHFPFRRFADDPASLKALVRREHTYGSDWVKTTNTGGYFSAGDDPARLTWFDDEMEALTSAAHQLGMPVAVHTGAPEGCKPAIRFASQRLLAASDVKIAYGADCGMFPFSHGILELQAMVKAD
jgi:imidazolonepropionase-like amidohydrolase